MLSILRTITIMRAMDMPPVYQTGGKWWRCSAIEFSDTSRHHNNPCVAPARVLFRQYAFADGADQSR